MTTFKTKDDVFTLLVHLGYLAYDKGSQEVYIPNREIATEFMNAIDEPALLIVLLVGINYDKRDKKHQCRIEAYTI